MRRRRRIDVTIHHERVERLFAGWPNSRMRELLPDQMLRDMPR